VATEPPPAAAAPSAAPVAPLATPLVTLRIESDPRGADVYGPGGVRLGRTPLEHRVPRGPGKADFVLKKGGYRDVRLSLSASRDGVGYLPLEKMPKAKRTANARPRSAHKTQTPRIDDGALDPFGE